MTTGYIVDLDGLALQAWRAKGLPALNYQRCRNATRLCSLMARTALPGPFSWSRRRPSQRKGGPRSVSISLE